MWTWHRIIIGDSRYMREVEDESVHLVVTSPPYPMIEIWDPLFRGLGCRDYDEMHEYLAEVWRECYRVLVGGGIACINIGDAARTVDGEFKIYPNHARVIENCERIGFKTLPYILWKKPTTKPKYKGKGVFLGSGFLPPNAYVTLDCEFILIFRKNGLRRFKPRDRLRYASRFTKQERDSWFTQIWTDTGARQSIGMVERRAAAFPESIPYKLIRMFSIIGDTVLDPFLGTGTTTKVALSLNRNSIGYEIDKGLLRIIKKKIELSEKMKRQSLFKVEVIVREDAGGSEVARGSSFT
ncbi:MAG: site-specific DNA-methyltransferase [Nitrososphaerota archaeon]